ncbi:UDP-N-acetylmuramate dehydrogenase [Paenibacillus koleovorans]|uniref:UDP-N-acetylmuramate dehydrogenase n=1 Tax=Paenibacillus koleovorans TaxID=121608 RepID=UPI000FD7F6F7|nr:UDP-N-acetylmuramate dehydrogenase [Paenibacillus koleovorans]
MQSVLSDLRAAQVGELLPNEPLAPYTTWKIGGPADLLVIPEGKAELVETIRILHRHGVPFLPIGRGSNMLVSDKGVRGVVVKLGAGLCDLRFEGNLAIVGGGYSLITLSVRAGKAGLTGLEFAGGIPGTVGGAVYMNAGAHGSDMSHILREAEIVLETGEMVRLGREDLQFAYRHSVLHALPGIVTEAVLELAVGDRKEMAATLASNRERRLRTQPLSLPCAGSTFRNPDHTFAAKLIEEAGLKGRRVGGAEVSTLHANFIINTGDATADDVMRLMDVMQTAVYERTGISLVPEVLMVGEK